MKHLENIARSAVPGRGAHCRQNPYGAKAIESFLRDVLALANSSVDGPRFIIIGVHVDNRGQKHFEAVDDKDFSGKPAYSELVNEFIEPPLNVRYRPVAVSGTQIGIFEIGDCENRPYMMRVDYSESLRRGDAYMRSQSSAVKMGRQQLKSLFEERFRDSIAEPNIDVGFPGDIIHKTLTLPSCDLSRLPSAVAASKLEQLLKINMDSSGSGSTTVMARLVHARLFGSDDPYVKRTPAELMQEIEHVADQYRDDDLYYLFETHAQKLQLVVCNQSNEPIVDASIKLILPKDDDLYVAVGLPEAPGKNPLAGPTRAQIAAYPNVTIREKAIHIAHNIGEIPVEEPMDVFDSPLRICVGPGLVGRRFGVRYAIHGQNLHSPTTGLLRINFRN